MSNEVIPSNGDATNMASRDPYQDYADSVSSRMFVGDLIRFTKHGEYKAGQDLEVIEEGTRMICHMPGMKQGWVKWSEGQPVQHLTGLVAEGFRAPPRDELGDMDENEWETLDDRPIDPWQKTNHLVMCDLDGNLYTFATSSKGGLSAVGQLSSAYGKRRRMKPDEIPLVELLARSYIHKDYGETFAPVLKIVGWVKIPQTFEDLAAIGAEEISDETIDLASITNGHDDEGDEGEDGEEDGDADNDQGRQEPLRTSARPTSAGGRTAAPSRSAPAASQRQASGRGAPQRGPARSASGKPAGKAGGKPAGKGKPTPGKGKGGAAGRRIRL